MTNHFGFREGDICTHSWAAGARYELKRRLNNDLWSASINGEPESQPYSEAFLTVVEPKFLPGDRVKHKLFGEGTLVEFIEHKESLYDRPATDSWSTQYDSGSFHHGDFTRNMTRLSLAEPTLKEETVTETKTSIRWTVDSRPPGIKIGDRVRVVGVRYPEDDSDLIGQEGYLLRDDEDENPFTLFAGPNLSSRFVCYATGIEAIEPSTPLSELEKLKADVYRLAEELFQTNTDWCATSKAQTFERLAALGVTAPKKRFRVSFEVEGEHAPTSVSHAQTMVKADSNFKAEEL